MVCRVGSLPSQGIADSAARGPPSTCDGSLGLAEEVMNQVHRRPPKRRRPPCLFLVDSYSVADDFDE